MGREAFRFQKNSFTLGGVDVHAANDEHVIRTSCEAFQAGKGTPAGAGGATQAGDVAGAVTQQGDALLCQGGKHQFTAFTFRQYFSGIRVNDFRQEVVFLYMQPVASRGAFHCHPRAHDFRKPVDVNSSDAHFLFHIAAHFFRPGFGSEHAHTQRQFPEVNALFDSRVVQVQGVRRCTANAGGTEVADQLGLAFG